MDNPGQRIADRRRQRYEQYPNKFTALEMVLTAGAAYGDTSQQYWTALKEANKYMSVPKLAYQLGISEKQVKAGLL